MGPALLKLERGSNHDVLHGAGHKNFVGLGKVAESGSDVHRQAADAIADQLALPVWMPARIWS
jgi:hypothetical protein